MTKPDIQTRKDLHTLLIEFYQVAIPDTEIGHHFVDMDLESHLPVIVDFWEKALFSKPVYYGNPMAVHQMLHEKAPLEREHFDRWVMIFDSTVDRMFEGPVADKAKQLAARVADSLHMRLTGVPIEPRRNT